MPENSTTTDTVDTLRRRVSRHNLACLLLGSALLLGSVFAWLLTWGMIEVFLFTTLATLDSFFSLRWPVGIIVRLGTFVGLVLVAVAGFRRTTELFDLRGYHESSLGGAFSSRRAVVGNYMLDAPAAKAFFFVEWLLLAPVATRDGIRQLRQIVFPSPGTLAAAAAIETDLKSRSDWTVRGRYHDRLDSVDLLLKLRLIWQKDERGIARLRVPPA